MQTLTSSESGPRSLLAALLLCVAAALMGGCAMEVDPASGQPAPLLELTIEPCDFPEEDLRDCRDAYGCGWGGRQACHPDGFWTDTCEPWLDC